MCEASFLSWLRLSDRVVAARKKGKKEKRKRKKERGGRRKEKERVRTRSLPNAQPKPRVGPLGQAGAAGVWGASGSDALRRDCAPYVWRSQKRIKPRATSDYMIRICQNLGVCRPATFLLLSYSGSRPDFMESIVFFVLLVKCQSQRVVDISFFLFENGREC